MSSLQFALNMILFGISVFVGLFVEVKPDGIRHNGASLAARIVFLLIAALTMLVMAQ